MPFGPATSRERICSGCDVGKGKCRGQGFRLQMESVEEVAMAEECAPGRFSRQCPRKTFCFVVTRTHTRGARIRNPTSAEEKPSHPGPARRSGSVPLTLWRQGAAVHSWGRA
jgi:hypothetical protein